LQRRTTCGINGAFPSLLQPALLRVYEWASENWHRLLQLEPTNFDEHSETKRTQKRGILSSIGRKHPKQLRTAHPPNDIDRPPLQDKHTLPELRWHKASDGPWTTATEAAIYRAAQKILWPGSISLRPFHSFRAKECDRGQEDDLYAHQ
jgi:hypothetical protein